MRKGFTLPLTIAVALLVSSAMALGPTISNVPDVYITTNTTTTTPDISATYNMFRYSNALVLWDYVTPGDTKTSDALYWTYGVKAATLSGGTGSYLTGSAVNYSINGLASVAPTGAVNSTEWNNAISTGATQKISEAGALTFRDIALSPLPSGPYSSPSPVVAGLPAGYLDLQEATLFVTDKATSAGFDTILMASVSFGVDTLSGGLKWTTERTDSSFTANTAWAFGKFPTIMPFTQTAPATGVVGAGTMTITTDVTATDYYGQMGTTGGTNDLAIVAGKLYRLQATLKSSNANVQINPDIRLVLNGKTTGPGLGELEFAASAGTFGPTTTDATFNAYLWPAASGPAAINIMAYDGANTRGGTLTITAPVKISTVDTASLLASSGTVKTDLGNGGITGPFVLGTSNGQFSFFGTSFGTALGYGTTFPSTSSGSGTALTQGVTGSLAAGIGGLTQWGASNLFTASANKLVVVMVRFQASTDTGAVPDSRIFLSRGGENPTVDFFLSRNLTAGSGPTTSAKNYYAVFDTAKPVMAGTWNIGIQTTAQATGVTGTITASRVTATEYEIPSE